MFKTYNPADIAGPFGHYDHGVEAVNVSRLLHVSGQVGTDPDGIAPDDVAAQIECVWRNIEAVLAEAGMTTGNIVRTITYMLDADYVPAARRRPPTALGRRSQGRVDDHRGGRPRPARMEGRDRCRRRGLNGRPDRARDTYNVNFEAGFAGIKWD